MAGVLYGGPRDMTLDVDAEGYRTYKVSWLVKSTAPHLDGTATILAAPGLPQPGAPWVFGGDSDFSAWCRPEATVRRHPTVKEGEFGWWQVEQTFSNKPPSREKERCNDVKIEDPLLEPPKVSGPFTRKSQEATYDRFGRAITTSSWEQIRGPQVEFDSSMPQIRIEQNVAALNLGLLTAMANTVNAAPLWGAARRTVKLSDVSFDVRYHGLCYRYYTRTLTFDIDYNTHDRYVLDEGTKVLNGKWNQTTGEWELVNIDGAAPDRNNPRHFIRYKDRRGENSKVVLNGAGLPAGVLTLNSSRIFVSRASSNLGNALSNSTKWIAVAGSITPVAWDEDTFYAKGSLVAAGVSTYVALYSQSGAELSDTDAWQTLVSGLSDAGNYSAATTYSEGQYVRDTTSPTAVSAGYIKVEKYAESDFLLLGIPVTF